MTYFSILESPIGPLMLTSNGIAITGMFIEIHKYGPAVGKDWERGDEIPILIEGKAQLTAYFEGKQTDFDLRLAPEGTEFQLRVWKELQGIPYGTTISYGELARRIGNPNASRAVGLANGRNPISIIIPCHRVIGSSGALTGYGGGLENKRTLLSLESGVLAKIPVESGLFAG